MENIVRIEASQNYCEFYFSDGKKMMVSKNIGTYEESLDPYHFMRIHRSHIINLMHVKEFVRHDGGMVKLFDGMIIEVSRQKRDELLERLERI
jgi:two-component system LytT family response regulator